MDISLFFLLFVIGFITNYFVNVNYLKKLREGVTNYKDIEVIFTAIFFGGPVLLLFLMFEEIRAHDKNNRHLRLISGVIITILQIIGIYLLFHFGLIKPLAKA
ncbi:MAG: hypothetical protein WC275_04065 [Bacilli bacterium]